MSDQATQRGDPEGGSLSGIGAFAIKTCIVGLVISACTIFVADWLIDSMTASAAETIATVRKQILSTPVGGTQFWNRIERELDRAADPSTDLPPAEKEKLLNDIRVIVARWRPFIETVQTGLQSPANAR